MDRVKAEGNLSQHVCHLELRNLHLSEWLAELNSVHRVIACGVEAVFSGSHGAPGDAESSLIQTTERALHSLDVEHVLLRYLHIIEHNHAGGGGAERVLAFDLGGLDSRHRVSLQDEAADNVLLILAPDNEHVGVRGADVMEKPLSLLTL